MGRTKEKQEDEKEKNPLHVDYPFFSNIRFIFREMFREEKRLRYLIPLGIMVAPVMSYLWTFISRYVLEMITDGRSWKVLLPLMLLFTVIQIGSTMLNTYYWSNTWYRYIGARMMLMTLMTRLNRKAMSIDYENLENPDVMDMFRKAQNSSGGNDKGVEGMMHTGVDCASKAAVVIVGMIIMGTLHPLLIVLLCVTATLSFIMSDRINAVTKKTVWDALAIWWRKNDYMNSVSTNFKAAKDIRMFHCRTGCLGKRMSWTISAIGSRLSMNGTG